MTHGQVVYPADCTAIIDVTKPPYNIDHTGKEDCTRQLIQIIDDIIQRDVDAFERTKAKLEAMPGLDAQISFEIKKENGRLSVIFPEDLPPARIIYFPNGTYLVSDTIAYSNENLVNINRGGYIRNEMNRLLHMMGESRDGVVIKLMDHCPGFGFGANKPVVSFMRGEQSNIAMTNSFENITIDVGRGNPGAVGLVFFGNNTGAVRHVCIKSSDDQYRGRCGLEVTHEIVSGCYIKHIEVIGFDYGIRVTPIRNFTVFEHITLKHQRKTGFYILNTITSIRGLYSRNEVPALRVGGPTAHVVVIDGRLDGGSELFTALQCDMGTIFARNIETAGYSHAISYGRKNVEGQRIDEYHSHEAHALFEGQAKRSIDLPIEETPHVPWETDLSKWVSVNAFGAKGDGQTDDTDAIQRAMNSVYSVIYFQPGKYLINDVIEIPAGVSRINFMYCDLVAGEKLQGLKEEGTFKVTGESEQPLVMEDLLAWEKYYGCMRLINHASTRTLVLSDLHAQTGALYFNSVEGGEVYMENVASTIGGEAYRHVPCFHFKGQQVWIRHLNPERSLKEVVNDRSRVWVLGFKTEFNGTSYETINGGFTEVLGGTISIGTNEQWPAIVNEESNVSVIASTNGYQTDHIFPIAVRETRNGEVRELSHRELPLRLMTQYVIPLYAGYTNQPK
ncbi:glycosyl hydrolase family 28-related protein [Paenibacillus sp. HB172176]|uniref:glycosyl hydrolase family 28-related protein n=1 Tax=Paenibacillus sp. HB172176 TaxID=2493690 RepID=UPI00143880AD|nr:glycosyl hydrolase family 28-related protein [Paenibacillus sp. HB172176]